MRGHGLKRMRYDIVEFCRGLLSLLWWLPEDLLFWARGRDWDFSTVVEGKKGELKTVTFEPESMVRANILLATDTSRVILPCGHADKRDGYRTRLKDVRIGGRSQFPHGGGILTLFLSRGSPNQRLRWDTCKLGEKIEIDVEFLDDCALEIVLFTRLVQR